MEMGDRAEREERQSDIERIRLPDTPLIERSPLRPAQPAKF